jgi:hypothetical protein
MHWPTWSRNAPLPEARVRERPTISAWAARRLSFAVEPYMDQFLIGVERELFSAWTTTQTSDNQAHPHGEYRRRQQPYRRRTVLL